MKYKFLFFLFFLFLLFYLYLSHINPESVKFYVGYGKHYESSVADYVVFSFVLGVLVSIIFGFFYDIKSVIIDWRAGKRQRRKGELKELFEKAKSYDLKGEREKAIEQMNRIIRKAPDMEDTYLFLADLYVSIKELDKGVEVLNLAETNLGKKEPVSLKKAKIYLERKDADRAESELKDILKINESNLEALSMLRDLYVREHNWDQALDVEKRVSKFIKTDEENRRLMGIRYEKARALLVKKGEYAYEPVLKDMKDVISEDKRFVPAYVLLAEIYKKTGKLNEAGRVYGRGYSKTGHIIFLSMMEDLYIERGTPEVILKIYRRILDVSPRNHLISFLYARLCLRLEMIDEAIDTLNVLLAEGLDLKALHKAMAEAYIHRGEIGKAVGEFRKAFPPEHVYIPFCCDNCQAKNEEWVDFCNTCSSWNTVNVKKENFLRVDSTDLRVLYENEDWVGEM